MHSSPLHNHLPDLLRSSASGQLAVALHRNSGRQMTPKLAVNDANEHLWMKAPQAAGNRPEENHRAPSTDWLPILARQRRVWPQIALCDRHLQH